MCLPNDNFTELLEFCYIYPRILIQEGTENLEAATGTCFNNQIYHITQSSMFDLSNSSLYEF